MLYELLTGHLPFRGKSANHTLVAIQDEEPPPLSAYLPEVPDLLQEVVADALSKDREARLTARQMLAKLQRLKRRVDAGARLDHSFAPNPTTPSGEVSGRAATPSQPGATASGVHPAVTAAGAAETQAAGAGGRARAHGGGRAWLAVALSAVALAGLGYGLYRLLSKKPAPFRSFRIEKLTNIGNATTAQISPDGQYVAHAVYEGGKYSLRVWHVSTKSSVEIITPAEDFLAVSAFSPDSRYIFYNRAPSATRRLTLYQIAVLGGESKKVLERSGSGVSFSPDGRRFAFVRPGTGGTL
ncbi:MAG: hypothetical protein LC795_11730 [Acidobacteria bacterium]|nr:hypothetical protein [Acidobacteriota bacterium]